MDHEVSSILRDVLQISEQASRLQSLSKLNQTNGVQLQISEYKPPFSLCKTAFCPMRLLSFQQQANAGIISLFFEFIIFGYTTAVINLGGGVPSLSSVYTMFYPPLLLGGDIIDMRRDGETRSHHHDRKQHCGDFSLHHLTPQATYGSSKKKPIFHLPLRTVPLAVVFPRLVHSPHH